MARATLQRRILNRARPKMTILKRLANPQSSHGFGLTKLPDRIDHSVAMNIALKATRILLLLGIIAVPTPAPQSELTFNLHPAVPGAIEHFDKMLNATMDALGDMVYSDQDSNATLPSGDISSNTTGFMAAVEEFFSPTQLIASLVGTILTFIILCCMDRLAKRFRRWANAKVVAKLVPNHETLEEGEESEVDYYVH